MRRTAGFTSTGLPAIQAFAGWVQSVLVPELTRWAGIITTDLWPRLVALGQWLIDARGWLIPIAATIAGVTTAIKVWTIAQKAWTLATTLQTTAQRILNTVLRANPIGIIITVVAGLVAGLIALYHSNEDARRIMDAAWNGIKAAIDAVVGWVVNTAVPWLKGAWDSIAGFATALYDAHVAVFTAVGDAIGGFVQAVKDFVSRVIDAHVEMARRVITAADGFVRFWRELPGKIWEFAKDLALKAAQASLDAGRALGDKIDGAAQGFVTWFRELPGNLLKWAGNMVSKGAQLAGDVGRGLVQGIKDFAGRIRDAFSDVIGGAINSAKKQLGIASPSRVFRVIGQQTGEGLEVGLESWEQRVSRAAARLAASAVEYGTPAPLNLGGAPALAAAGPTINIQVYALDPTPDVGRRIAQALRPYLARGGAL